MKSESIQEVANRLCLPQKGLVGRGTKFEVPSPQASTEPSSDPIASSYYPLFKHSMCHHPTEPISGVPIPSGFGIYDGASSLA